MGKAANNIKVNFVLQQGRNEMWLQYKTAVRILQRGLTSRAGLAIRLQVDPSRAGTAVTFWKRRQKAQVTAASIVHFTRRTYYGKEDEKPISQKHRHKKGVQQL